MKNEARHLYELGFAVHWLEPRSKAPVKGGWSSPTRDSWEALGRDYRNGYGLGVRLGAPSKLESGYLCVVDIDLKSGDQRHTAEAFACVEERFPGLMLIAPSVTTGRGLHLYGRTLKPVKSGKIRTSNETVKVYSPTSPMNKKQAAKLTPSEVAGGFRIKNAWEVEFMSAGKQVVLPPTLHPDTGAAYKWLRPLGLVDDLPWINTGVEDTVGDKPRASIEDFTAVGVDLVTSNLSDRIVAMILTGEDVDDRSNACFSVTLAMLKSKFTDQEIMSVLTDRSTFLGETAFDHRKTTSRAHAAAWVHDYCIVKAREQLRADRAFSEEVGVTPLLDGGGAAAQTVELEIRSAEQNGFYLVGKNGSLKPNYNALMNHFQNAHPYRTIAEMKCVYLFTGSHYEHFTVVEAKAFAENRFQPAPDERIRTEFYNKLLANEVVRRGFFTETIENRINFKNGILDLADPIEGEVFIGHSPEYGFRSVLPYNFDPTARCPIFEAWLDDIMLGDKDLTATVQEFMGYIVRGGEYRYHKALWLGGEGRNGKSTFIDVLKALIGSRNFSTISIKSLVSDKFAGADLDGKIANFSEETSPQELSDSGPFKNLTGDGEIFAQKKYGDPYSFRNRAKLVMTYNQIPDLKDLSAGMLSRPIIIPFRKNIEEKNQDHDIGRKLKSELSGIFNFALAGWKRLEGQNAFTQSEASRKAHQGLREESCNVFQWVEHHLEFDNDVDPNNPPMDTVKRAFDLYEKYRHDERFPYRLPEFFRRLNRHPEMAKRRKKIKHQRCYFGCHYVVAGMFEN